MRTSLLRDVRTRDAGQLAGIAYGTYRPRVCCTYCGTTQVLIDRHIEKNGGTTFRGLLQSNERLGRCKYVGMSTNERQIVGALRTRGHEATRTFTDLTNSTNRSRVCAEHHFGGFWHTIVALRRMPPAALTAGGCTGIRVVMRIREPFAWYVSWYLWQSAYNGRKRLNATTLPANLQSRIIIGTPGNVAPDGTAKCGRCGPLTSAERAQLTHYLSLVDILAPMDCYVEMVVLLTQVVGDWFATTFLDQNVHGLVRADRPGLSGPLDLRNASDLCDEDDPQLPRCRELVRSLAADDHRLYQTAVGRFALQLQQAEASPAWVAAMGSHRAGMAEARREADRQTARKTDRQRHTRPQPRTTVEVEADEEAARSRAVRGKLKKAKRQSTVAVKLIGGARK